MIISTFLLHVLELGRLYSVDFSGALELPVLQGISGIEGDTRLISTV